MKVAVFGSREWPETLDVQLYLAQRWNPNVTIVSGGARGVDSMAENVWLKMGGSVLSFRPKKRDDSWLIEHCELGAEPRIFVDPRDPTFEDFKSAAFYRNMLIAEAADRGVAFWHKSSRGTGHTIGCFETLEKPCSLHKS